MLCDKLASSDLLGAYTSSQLIARRPDVSSVKPTSSYKDKSGNFVLGIKGVTWQKRDQAVYKWNPSLDKPDDIYPIMCTNPVRFAKYLPTSGQILWLQIGATIDKNHDILTDFHEEVCLSNIDGSSMHEIGYLESGNSKSEQSEQYFRTFCQISPDSKTISFIKDGSLWTSSTNL
jgi:hypothetical protein